MFVDCVYKIALLCRMCYYHKVIAKGDLYMDKTTLDNAKQALLQELSAMANSQQWDAHVKEKNKDFSGVIDVQKSE